MSSPPRFDVRVEVGFDASHRLGADGSSAQLHSHAWRVAVGVRSEQLDPIAIVVDFRKLRADTDHLLDELRGGIIEDHPEFVSRPATAAGVADWLLGRLQRGAEGKPYRVFLAEVGCDPGITFIAGESATAG